MFKIKLFDLAGEEISIGKLYFLELEKDYFSPADRLSAQFHTEGNATDNAFSRLEGYWEDEKIFDGYIDVASFERTPNGRFLKVESRSLISVLLDNEALPGSYTDISLQTVYNTHVGRFSCFKGLRTDEGDSQEQLDSFTIPKGVSEWHVLEHFCKIALGKKPRLDIDGYIKLKSSYDYNEYTVSSSVPNAIPYTALYFENHEDEVITQVRLLDKYAHYAVVDNEYVTNFSPPRIRYIRSTAEWQGYTNVNAQDIIKSGMQKRQQIKCVLPGIYPIQIGDHVNVNDSMCYFTGLFVAGVQLKVDPSGFFTSLTLLRPEYF